MALLYNFVQVFECGQLALSQRPKIKEVKKLVNDNCNRVVTILPSRREQAHLIGAEVESYGMKWEWVKVAKATNFTLEEKTMFSKAIDNSLTAIISGESIIVHCSAGLHRTGIFAYSLLRNGGMNHEEALLTIGKIRQETADALEEKYLEIANTFIKPLG